jgi:hypothetical protein
VNAAVEGEINKQGNLPYYDGEFFSDILPILTKPPYWAQFGQAVPKREE